jgi:hypothetical protein
MYRTLKTQFDRALGSPWQGTSHSRPDTSDQVIKVMKISEVYKLHLAAAEGIERRTYTVRGTIDIVLLGKETLQKKGMKAWAKWYTKWVQGISVDEELNGEMQGIDDTV